MTKQAQVRALHAMAVGTVLLVFALLPKQLSAQCVMTYSDGYADASTVYGWNVLIDYWSYESQDCNPGTPNFTHYYHVCITITSPTGRTASAVADTEGLGNGFITEAPVELPIAGESGLFSFTKCASLWCSVAWGGAGGYIFAEEAGGGGVQVEPYLHVSGAGEGQLRVGHTRLSNCRCHLRAFCWSDKPQLGFRASDGSGISGQNLGNTSWSGLMVITGIIRVDFTGGYAECNVTVSDRNWQLVRPPLLNPTNGAANGTYVILPTPPQQQGNEAGTGVAHNEIVLAGSVGANPPTDPGQGFDSWIEMPGGPNNGYRWFTEPMYAVSDYQINPDLLNQTSPFSLRQCGQMGYISWSNLLSQTRRHEYNHPDASHYGQFGKALTTDVGGTNPGTYLERKVWGPGGGPTYPTWDQFYNDIVVTLITKRDAIYVFTQSNDNTVYPVNYTATGNPIGMINYPPYNPQC